MMDKSKMGTVALALLLCVGMVFGASSLLFAQEGLALGGAVVVGDVNTACSQQAQQFLTTGDLSQFGQALQFTDPFATTPMAADQAQQSLGNLFRPGLFDQQNITPLTFIAGDQVVAAEFMLAGIATQDLMTTAEQQFGQMFGTQQGQTGQQTQADQQAQTDQQTGAQQGQLGQVSLPISAFFHCDNEQINRVNLYFDRQTFMTQLGFGGQLGQQGAQDQQLGQQQQQQGAEGQQQVQPQDQQAAAGTCIVTVPQGGAGVNLRESPSTDSVEAGSLTEGQTAQITGQMTAEDGMVWWQTAQGLWVRSDVVTVQQGDCATVPTIGGM